MPATVMVETVVYLQAGVDDSTLAPMLPLADEFVLALGARARRILHGDSARVSSADELLPWRQESAALLVTVYRDARYTWRLGPPDTSATGSEAFRVPLPVGAIGNRALLERTMSATVSDTVRLMLPQALHVDSVTFTVSLFDGAVRENGAALLPPPRFGVPIATIRAPWVEPVQLVSGRPPRYPDELRRVGLGATILMQFVVDADGRAEPATIRDLWRSSVPRPSGIIGDQYYAFVRAAIPAILSNRYLPLRVGGCPVRQLVQQPMVFQLR